MLPFHISVFLIEKLIMIYKHLFSFELSDYLLLINYYTENITKENGHLKRINFIKSFKI